jgi:hypothetical protein
LEAAVGYLYRFENILDEMTSTEKSETNLHEDEFSTLGMSAVAGI